MVLNLAAVKGSVSIGTGQYSGSMGDVRASDYGGGLADAVSSVVVALAGAGGGIINVLPGVYDLPKNWEQTVGSTIVNLHPGAVLRIRHSGAVGVGRIKSTTPSFGADGSGVIGRGTILVDRFVANQVCLSFEDVVDPVLQDIKFKATTTEAKLLTTRMRFFDILRCHRPQVIRPRMEPNWGIQAALIQHGNHLTWQGGYLGKQSFHGIGGLTDVPEREHIEAAPGVFIEFVIGVPCAAGVALEGMEWFEMSGLHCYGIGDGTANVADCLKLQVTGSDLSWVASDSSINSAAGAFTDIVVGDVFRSGGFPSSPNNGYFKVTTKSSNNKLIVEKAIKASPPVDETGDSDSTVKFTARADYLVKLQRLFPPTSSEQGHMILEKSLFEMSAYRAGVNIWGVNNANLQGNVLGYAAGGPAFLKEGHVVVTGSDGTASGFEGSAVHLRGNDIHNPSDGDDASGVYVEKCQLVDIEGGSFEVNSNGRCVRIASGSVRRATIEGAKFSTLLPAGHTNVGGNFPILFEAGTIADTTNGGFAVDGCKWNGYKSAITVTGTVYSCVASGNKINRSSGDFTAGTVFAAGMWIRVVGFRTNGQLRENGTTEFYCRIDSLTATDLTVSGITLVDEAAGATVEIGNYGIAENLATGTVRIGHNPKLGSP